MPDPKYLSTDPNAGTTSTGYLSTDPNAGHTYTPDPSMQDFAARTIANRAGYYVPPKKVTDELGNEVGGMAEGPVENFVRNVVQNPATQAAAYPLQGDPKTGAVDFLHTASNLSSVMLPNFSGNGYGSLRNAIRDVRQPLQAPADVLLNALVKKTGIDPEAISLQATKMRLQSARMRTRQMRMVNEMNAPPEAAAPSVAPPAAAAPAATDVDQALAALRARGRQLAPPIEPVASHAPTPAPVEPIAPVASHPLTQPPPPVQPSGNYLHGSSADISQFQTGAHGATYLSPTSGENVLPGRTTQAEHIARGPFGGKLYQVAVDEAKVKSFDPLNDPRAQEIYTAVIGQPSRTGLMPYGDMPALVKAAAADGYNSFRVHEPSVQGVSRAITDPALLRITAKAEAPGFEMAPVASHPLTQPRVDVGAEVVGRDSGLGTQGVRDVTGPRYGEAPGEAAPVFPETPYQRMRGTLLKMHPSPGDPAGDAAAWAERLKYANASNDPKSLTQLITMMRMLRDSHLALPAAVGGGMALRGRMTRGDTQ